VGGGIGSLAAAAFMIRDGNLPGGNISILEAARHGRKSGRRRRPSGRIFHARRTHVDHRQLRMHLGSLQIDSLTEPRRQDGIRRNVEFNEKHKANSMARLVDRRRAKVPVTSMGFSMQDRIELLKLSQADEDTLGASRITDWLSPGFFETEFWYMWSTTFAFQPWHSAVEFKRYLHRFMLEFSRIETLAGVKRTIYNQYDSLVLPLQTWLEAQGVHLVTIAR
jgi:oleate hydratase